MLIQTHKERLAHWVPLALVSFVLGIIIHVTGWKMNKQLWSPSYLFFMAGCTGILLSSFYVLMDWVSWQPTWTRKAVKVVRLHRMMDVRM